MNDREMMEQALELAREAAKEGEVPVGCVVTLGDRVVGRGRNRREREKDALCHAELEAIHQACRTLGGWRLWQCTLYVTLEPCPMCAGAIINARIPRVVFGAWDGKAGSCGSICDLFSMPYNHRPVIEGGVLETECAGVLRDFFRVLRASAPMRPRWRRSMVHGSAGETEAEAAHPEERSSIGLVEKTMPPRLRGSTGGGSVLSPGAGCAGTGGCNAGGTDEGTPDIAASVSADGAGSSAAGG